VEEQWAELWQPVDVADDRVRRGVERLADRRGAELAAGVTHLGWKVGWNNLEARRSLGVQSGVVGFLTVDRVCRDGTVGLAGTKGAALEVELALRVAQVGGRFGVVAIAPAFEVLDVPSFDVDDGIALNVWHHAVVLGAEQRYEDGMLDELRIAVRSGDDRVRYLDPPSVTLGPLDALLAFVDGGARLLHAHLAEGDVILSGNLTRAPRSVAVDDVVEADFGVLGPLAVRFA
jgi:2-keto-4-pentenoate hydratase